MTSDTRELRRNWEQELRLARIYEALAKVAKTGSQRSWLESMALEERDHAAAWESVLAASGANGGPPRPGLTARLAAAGARVFGVPRVLALVGVAEGQILRGYLGQVGSFDDERAEGVLRHVISDESSHAGGGPAATAAQGTERLHGRAGSIRNVIYGLNDGLTATLGVLAGVGGATANPSVVLVGGLAAMTASGVSMAGGAYLATKSQREVYEDQLTRAASAIEAMPQLERRELEQIYRAKGLTDAEAKTIVDRITSDKRIWLQTQTREELGLVPEQFEDPVREAIAAGISTLVGGAVPVIAYLIARFVAGSQSFLALLITFAICLACLFVIGSGRAYFTGKGTVVSGLEMMGVGTVVAAVTYVVGAAFKGA